eukprot:4206170-Pleurochrysis_carterae.AAC.1
MRSSSIAVCAAASARPPAQGVAEWPSPAAAAQDTPCALPWADTCPSFLSKAATPSITPSCAFHAPWADLLSPARALKDADSFGLPEPLSLLSGELKKDSERPRCIAGMAERTPVRVSSLETTRPCEIPNSFSYSCTVRCTESKGATDEPSALADALRTADQVSVTAHMTNI